MVDRKGVSGYSFSDPSGPGGVFDCRKCGAAVSTVAPFTEVDEDACARDLYAQRCEPCGGCGERIRYSVRAPHWSQVELQEHLGRRLCDECMLRSLGGSENDPSDATRKYVFDRRTRRWTLDKVLRSCVTCGRKRWLKDGNAWKKQCIACYRAARPQG